jgi:hypothetical protein
VPSCECPSLTRSCLSLVSPRAGGHSYAAYGLGGTNGALVIDLQRIKQVSVDASTGEAVIGTGSRLGDIALSLNNQGGRALPHGTCPYVGLGGHASFGGRVLRKIERMNVILMDELTTAFPLNHSQLRLHQSTVGLDNRSDNWARSGFGKWFDHYYFQDRQS